MTKKELNAIRHHAFLMWAETPDGIAALQTPHEYFSGWRLAEGDRVKLLLTEFDTQINKETLKSLGFSADASAKKLFVINRKAKTLTPIGWDF